MASFLHLAHGVSIGREDLPIPVELFIALPGTVALLVVMIGTTTFDGFTGGPIWTGGDADGWQGLAVTLTDGFAAVGFAQDTALELALYGDNKVATRSQYWMLAVMVGFTSLALYLLSA